ncbi:MAG TPA: hypothetical protein VD866_21415 [Urbifossiella sp.]|nr:hypothetical protein [Urbifossiella sp.]
MRGKLLAAFGLAAAVVAVATGCHHDKHGLMYTPKEEVVLPADEARFNNPPSAPYKRRPAKSGDDKALLGRDRMMGGGGGGGPGGPGF